MRHAKLLLTSAILVIGCTHANNEAVPMFSVSSRTVQYGPNPWQVADIVFPHPYDQPVNAESPVVIWIHGGGWNSGSRGDIANKVKLFTQRTGIIGLNIDYRLGTETVPCWPGASEDIEAAAAFALSDAMPCISGPIYATLSPAPALNSSAARASSRLHYVRRRGLCQ